MLLRSVLALGGLLCTIAAGALAQSAETVGDASPGPFVEPDRGAPVWTGPNGPVLFDNGPLVTDTGAGAGGADLSVVQNETLGLTVLGFAHSLDTEFQVADDFEVPPGGWRIDEMVFFAYQTGSTTASTITDYRVRIWDGPPADSGSSVVWGNLATNVLIDTAWADMYRSAEAFEPTNTERPIMANTVSIGTVLPAGSYWLEWEAAGSLPSGPWAPPVTVVGQTTTGNALQSADDGATFVPLDDNGALAQQGLPFLIIGSVPLPESLPVPAVQSAGLALLALLVAALAAAVLRRT